MESCCVLSYACVIETTHKRGRVNKQTTLDAAKQLEVEWIKCTIHLF